MKTRRGLRPGTGFLLVLAAAAWRLSAQSASVPASAHPIWEIRGQSNSVYVLGSIHFARDDFYPLPKPVEQAYERCSVVVFETDIGEMRGLEIQGKLLKAGLCPPGETLGKRVGKETYAALQSWLKKTGAEPSALDPMRPWLASVSLIALELQKLGFNPNRGIDEHFYTRAKDDKKEIRGLETADFQISLFANLSREEDELFLKSMLEDVDRFPRIFKDVIDAWKAGDAAKIEPLLMETTRNYPAIQRRFLTDRNKTWLPRIEEWLRGNQDVFVVVGMAHLVGKDGLVDLLRKKGFHVEQR
jgi:uncharacterized protein YbaP (TraB family)